MIGFATRRRCPPGVSQDLRPGARNKLLGLGNLTEAELEHLKGVSLSSPEKSLTVPFCAKPPKNWIWRRRNSGGEREGREYRRQKIINSRCRPAAALVLLNYGPAENQ